MSVDNLHSQSKSQYMLCCEEAVKTQKPLIVFVKCSPFRIKGAIVHHMPEGASFVSDAGIVVSRPKGDWLEWVETLKPSADGHDVVLSLKKQKLPYTPPPTAPPSSWRTAPAFGPTMGIRSSGSC